MSHESMYDLLEEAEKVRSQVAGPIDPMVEARNLVTQAIMSRVLLSLADIGFYEFAASRSKFTIPDVVAALKSNEKVTRALIEFLAGCGLLKFGDGTYMLTEKGARHLNVYTRGILNVYLGGYSAILHRLTDLLENKVRLEDKELRRSSKHAAVGTPFATSIFAVPKVFEVMKSFGSRSLLDLGCGSCDFLISYLRLHPTARGWGVDRSAEALEQGRRNAKRFGVEDRLNLYLSEVGSEPLPIPQDELQKIDVVTSIYMLHEFGRDGDGAIVQVMRGLAKQLPGKRLLALEFAGVSPSEFQGKNPEYYGQLYHLIHVLSLQGLPKKAEEWQSLFNQCGFEIDERGVKLGASFIYVVRFPDA